jgi:60 kDa SS-A/Ro ribonucleoprotein
MANTQLFTTRRIAPAPVANAINEAGGRAYLREPEAALALYASTGCLNGVYYADAQMQLAQVLDLCSKVSAQFVAQTAIHARKQGHMKDMPALLAAYLAHHDGELLARVFDRVIDNGRMLRNFVQILRSGVVGRKSLGTRSKRLVQQWLEAASVETIMAAAIGNQPSLADIVKMTHPKPANAEREALYAWLIGKPYVKKVLPQLVRDFESYKRKPVGSPPNLPFLYLTSLQLNTAQWKKIAQRASWQATRMNLNTFLRHGVFDDKEMVQKIAKKLTDKEEIRRARVFPYQLFAAWKAANGLPAAIMAALEQAMEHATANVPLLPGNVVVAVDVSGSMASPVTGTRPGSTTALRCVDVAALIAASVKRKNPSARILPFDTQVRTLPLSEHASVMNQAQRLAALCGGGTTVSAPLKQLNAERAHVDTLIVVSDNESWIETNVGMGTRTMYEWSLLRQRCPNAKLVAIDLAPYATSQTVASDDVLHVGGFSDTVFELLADAATGHGPARWVERIRSIAL